MKAKILALSLIWASLLIATSMLLHRTPHYGTMFALLLVGAVTSMVILVAPDCPRKAAFDGSPSGEKAP